VGQAVSVVAPDTLRAAMAEMAMVAAQHHKVLIRVGPRR
jgi:hypothetical protein